MMGYSDQELDLLDQLLAADGIDVAAAAPIPRCSPDEQQQLSFAQQRLWFLDQLDPGNPAYNIPFAVRMTGALDRRALQRSLQAIVERHETLASAFQTVGGQAVQVRTTPDLALPELDLSALAEAERTAALHREIVAEAQRPFELATGPLIRAGLVRLADAEYVLLLTLHHIVSDGWSTGVLVRELAHCYGACVSGRPIELAALPIQYADYAAWQREQLRGPRFEADLQYWREQLAGAPIVLDLPTDRPRPPVQTYNGANDRFTLPAALVRALNELSQREDVTLFMTVLAAFQTVLYRYTGQSDIVTGTPIAGRTRAETEGLIGCFVNSLALRTDLSGNPTFRQLLGRVRATAIPAFSHQDTPFEMIVDALHLERNLSHPPLFQTMLALQNAPLGALELPGLTLSPLPVDSGTAKFDLTLLLFEQDGAISGAAEYNCDLFDAATIARLATHLTTLLESVVADPDQPIDSLTLLSAAERRQVLAWNTAVTPAERDLCLHHWFESGARWQPDAIAVTYEDAELSYAELNGRANQLAHRLQELGVGPEVCVALWLDRSLELVVAILATLKAGGAYLPLDPAYPPDRLAYILEDSRAPVLLTQQALRDQLSWPGGEVVCLDRDWAAIAEQPATNPVSAVGPDNLAYVIYTSGSTGKPKGVQITHGHVTRLFTATERWFAFNRRDVWTLFHSYAFDFSVWELWGALLYGGRLVVVPYVVSRAPDTFYRLLCREGVTVLNQTPSAFRQLIAAEANQPPTHGLALRYVIFGGEALELRSLQPWIERHGVHRPQLVNMYGITETTVHVTYRPLALADILGGAASVIGCHIPDLQMYVLDAAMQPAPIGVAGELYIGGAGLARGYLGRPALTAQRFVPDPFGVEPGARLYKTGDLARYRADGDLEYLGRIDQQVKLRGFRIELGEIEATLQQHAAVRQVVVLARQDQPGDARLIAYIVPQPEHAPTVSDLRAFLQLTLPSHMIPAAFVLLEALPLTANGKLNRAALPAVSGERPDLGAAYEAPTTPTEATLVGIWAEVLGLYQVGIRDNFFALGGDSIRSVRIVALAEAQGLHLTLQDLFRHQTVAELAEAIAGAEQAEQLPATAPFSLISAEDRRRMGPEIEDAYPLTMLQAGMLLHIELLPATSVYHNVNSYYLRFPFDLDTFRASVQQVVARHAVLRTSFDLASYSEPLQLVHRSAELEVGSADLRGLIAPEQEAIIREYVELARQRRFDVAEPPLLRFFIHQRTDDAVQLTLTEFHPILDGWSLHTTLTEIFERYFALRNTGALPETPQPAAAFRDFVQLERLALESEDSRAYWSAQLGDATVLKLPRPAHLPPIEPSTRMRRQPIAIPAETAAGLQRLAQAEAVPLKSVLLAAHLKALSLISGQSDVLTGLVANGRPEVVGGERICGLFLNTVPFRLRLPVGSWRDLARSAFEAEGRLLPHRRYPLVALQRQWGGGEALFEAAFNYVHFHVMQDLFESQAIEALDFTILSEETHFPMQAAFSSDVASGAVALHLEYDATILSDDQIARIGGYYQRVLAAIARDPHSQHHSASFLAADEQDQLDQWNATEQPYPEPYLLHTLIERQAGRTPDAIALVYEQQRLTYAELNGRANQLAQYLRARGVGPEIRVAICVERSIEMVVGLLGILKAGGAYVPLDPSYPVDRLQFMLQDAQAPVLLTQQHLLRHISVRTGHIICLDRDWPTIAEYPAINQIQLNQPHNLAYVIYTSGSTGKPKGAMNTHAAIVNRLHWMQQAYQLTPADRVLQKTPFSFDVSVWEFFWPLLTGARLVMARPGGHQEPDYLAATIQEHAITTLHFVPSMLQLFLEAPNVAQCASLRQIICSGEALPYELQQRCFARLATVELHNLYGPTEAAVDVTAWACVRNSAEQVVPIGRPIANTQMYILDAQLQPVPVGVAGELHIGGVQLARGYLNRPALTAEKFIPNPFGTGRSNDLRLYKTGDLACWRPDGAIEYLGRIDHQIKIRGLRIELGEIETALQQHPAIRDAVVIGREDTPGEKRLAAYIVIGATPAPSITELRAFLHQYVPEYMVPSAFVTLDALPLSPNGKVDRKALPAPVSERPDLITQYIAPRTPLERTLAGLWQEALHVDKVGVQDNFFDLGGDSLRLARVHNKLRAALNRDLPLVLLFQFATISSLAEHLTPADDPQPALQASYSRAELRRAQQQRQDRVSRTPQPVTGDDDDDF